MVKSSKFSLLFFTLLFLAGILAAVFGPLILAKSNIKNILKAYGLEDVMVTNIDRSRGELMFSGISLDPDGFSFIETIRARASWPGLISNQSLFSQLLIDNLHLTGELKANGDIAVSGWKPVAAFPFSGAEEIILNGGTLDLMTTDGVLRLEAKGRVSSAPAPENIRVIQAAVWGAQHQLTLESRWDARIKSDQGWDIDGDLQNIRLNLKIVDLSRAQGWTSFSYNPSDETVKIAGEITAGQLIIGEKTALSNIHAALNGQLSDYKLVLKAASAHYDNVELTADINFVYSKAGPTRIIITAPDSDSLFEFLTDLKTDLENITTYGESLAKLLVTPGNIARLKEDLGKVKYDYLTLVITGNPYDLAGKVVAQKVSNGITRSAVISMNPGAEN